MKKSKLLLSSTALLTAVTLAPALSSCGNSLSASKKVNGTQFSDGTLKYEVIDETAKTCKVVKYDGDKPTGTLTIPPTVNGYTVVEIGPNAFNYCKGITNISITGVITKIGEFAFKDCTGLSGDIYLESVDTIGDGAFMNCSGITSINSRTGAEEAKGVLKYLKTIGISAFKGCSSLTTIARMPNLEKLGASAFRGCSALKGMKDETDTELPFTIGQNCKSIGELAFYGVGQEFANKGLAFTKTINWYVKGSDPEKNTLAPSADPITNWTNYSQNFIKNEIVLYTLVENIRISADKTGGYSDDKIQLTATVDDKATLKKVTWTTSDPTLAVVDSESGVVTVKAAPNEDTDFTITATAADGGGATKTISLKALKVPVTEVKWYVDSTSPYKYQHSFCFQGTTRQFKAEGELSKPDAPEKFKAVKYYLTDMDDVELPVENDIASIDSQGILTVKTSDVTKIKVWACSAFNSELKISNPFVVNLNTVLDVTDSDNVRTVNGFVQYFDGDEDGLKTKINELYSESGLAIECPNGYTIEIADNAFNAVSKTWLTSDLGITKVLFKGLTNNFIPKLGKNAFMSQNGKMQISEFAIDGQESVIFTDLGDYALSGTAIQNIVIEADSSLGEGFCKDCLNLGVAYFENYKIPEDYAYINIPDYAFSGCSKLYKFETHIVWGYCNISSIGKYAFANAFSDESIESTTFISTDNNYREIREGTFSGCTKLTSFAVPDSVKTIGDYAFKNCSSLTEVQINSNVNSIGVEAYTGCTGLTNVTFDITSGWYKFRQSAAETAVEITGLDTTATAIEKLKESSMCRDATISGFIFTPNSSTESEVTGVSVRWNGTTSFGIYNTTIIPNTYSIKGFRAPVSSFDESQSTGAFENCTSLGIIVIPDNITSIPKNCFKGCSALYSVTLPKDVISFGANAFTGTNFTWEYASVFLTDKSNKWKISDASGTLWDPAGKSEHDIATDIINNSSYSWNKYETLEKIKFTFSGTTPKTATAEKANNDISGQLIIPATVKDGEGTVCNVVKVGSFGSFFGTGPSITSVIIPETVTLVDDSAFEGCSSITSIEFAGDSQLTKLGTSAFGGTNLKSIKFGSKLAEIGSYIFGFGSDTGSVESVIFDSDCPLNEIGWGAFSYSKVKSINVPKNVTKIGQYAFVESWGTPNLASLTFDDLDSTWTIQDDEGHVITTTFKPSGDPAADAATYKTNGSFIWTKNQ